MHNKSKITIWIKKASNDKRLSCYLAMVLLLFALSFFLVEISKARNNFYYVFFATPTLLVFTFNLVNKKPFKADYSFYLLLLYFLFSFVATGFSDNEPYRFFRHISYIFILFYGLLLCIREQNICRIIALLYAGMCCTFILITFYYWQKVYFSTGIFPRIHLNAAAYNPVHASLMILTGWLGFWITYGLPRLIKLGRLPYLSGFVLMESVAVFICIAFQSRSCLLGLLAVTAAWLIVGKERQLSLLLTLSLVFIFFAGGYDEVFLTRGNSYRFEIWRDVLWHLNDNGSWLTGVKQEGRILYLGKFRHPHSAYLSILAQTGLVGIISFFLFTCVYFFQGIKKRSPWFIVSLLGWAALLTSSNGVVNSPQPLWIYFWLPTLLAILNYHKHSEN